MLLRKLTTVTVVAVAGAALSLVAPTAQAAPVFDNALTVMRGDNDAHDDSGDCSYAETNGDETPVPVVENGPAVTVSTSSSATYVSNTDPADTGAGSSQATATGKVTSAGGSLKTLDLAGSGSAQVAFALPTSDCQAHIYSGAYLEFRFTVAQAGFLHLAMKSSTSQYGEVYLYQVVTSGDQDYFEKYGFGVRSSGTADVYLPAGTYGGYLESESSVDSAVNSSISGSSTVHADFAVAGSQTEAVSGKGKKYVTFPAARSCATDTVLPSVTSKRKRVDDIEQVKFFVNDKLVKKVRTPDKGDVVKLPVADDVTADVRVEVKLFPSRQGRPGKILVAGASYEACS